MLFFKYFSKNFNFFRNKTKNFLTRNGVLVYNGVCKCSSMRRFYDLRLQGGVKECLLTSLKNVRDKKNTVSERE